MWADALRHLAIGWEIIVALGLGYLVGWWLDRSLHTSPYLKIVGVVLGATAGVKALMRVIRDYRQEVGPDDPVDPNAPPPRRPERHARPRKRQRGPDAQ
jgi:F0F1-type ATP synthase assembly protein I